MKIITIGIDLGKTVFHLVGMDERGTITMKKRLSRPQVITLLANTPACTIGMEASCGSHHLGRELTAQGHEVRLIPAQFVKPFVKSQKNDYVDAESHRGGSSKTNDAFRPHQDGRPTRPASSSSGARPIDRTQNRHNQSAQSIPARARTGDAYRPKPSA
jgi:hypothetical protein